MSDVVLSAPYVLEYTYTRSVGPVIGRFFTMLREGRIEGVRTSSGKVLVPPTEYDPETGEPTVLLAGAAPGADCPTDNFVEVGQSGIVKTWAWVAAPRAANPLSRAFAWALIQLDGADTALLHAVDAGSMDRMKTGMRVRVKWAEERIGRIQDIACFVPEES